MISTVLTEEKGVPEEMNEYLIFSSSVFANEQSIYKIKKSDATEIFKLLLKWSTKDWGQNYEARP